MIEQPPEPKPALTIVIRSWWTPALAVIMLVVGLLAGYFGGQLLHGSSPSRIVAAAATPTPTTDPTQAAQVDQMMKELIGQTTNFMGDPSAKVTLIEFSDYQ